MSEPPRSTDQIPQKGSGAYPTAVIATTAAAATAAVTTTTVVLVTGGDAKACRGVDEAVGTAYVATAGWLDGDTFSVSPSGYWSMRGDHEDQILVILDDVDDALLTASIVQLSNTVADEFSDEVDVPGDVFPTAVYDMLKQTNRDATAITTRYVALGVEVTMLALPAV